jgi:septum formation protein
VPAPREAAPAGGLSRLPHRRLILGSASPRRREILAQLGYEPEEVRPPHIDETPLKGELPRAYARRLAREKAEALEPAPDEVILCADTTVALGRRILGKPEDEREAASFLRALSGRRHRVITAVAVRDAAGIRERDVVSLVRFKRLSEEDIAEYLATGDWRGKAGGYAIQGPAAGLIPWVSGSWSAIVGLPAYETRQLLRAAGLRPRHSQEAHA